MSLKSFGMGDFHASQDAFSSRHEAMDIMAEANTKRVCHGRFRIMEELPILPLTEHRFTVKQKQVSP
jgi:hypothetical protein